MVPPINSTHRKEMELLGIYLTSRLGQRPTKQGRRSTVEGGLTQRKGRMGQSEKREQKENWARNFDLIWTNTDLSFFKPYILLWSLLGVEGFGLHKFEFVFETYKIETIFENITKTMLVFIRRKRKFTTNYLSKRSLRTKFNAAIRRKER